MTPLEQVATAIAEHGRPNWVAHVPHTVRNQVPLDTMLTLLAQARWSTETLERENKHQTIINWCAKNLFAETTVADLANLSGLSEVSVRKLIKDRPDLFRKVGYGTYEVRNPKADREAGK